MDNELEQKRKEKVEGFKISFNDDDDIPQEKTGTAGSISSSETPEIRSDEGIPAEHHVHYDSEEITSYSDDPAGINEQLLDKDELRAAKRLDRKRSNRKARK